MKKIALIGSTGSIGRQVLNCVDRHPDKFKITSLSAGSNAKLLAEQIEKYKPEIATLTNPENASLIKSINSTTLYFGENSMEHAITPDCDIVVVSVVGFCGLKCVLKSIEMDKTVALANKEALVAGGKLVTDLLKKHPKAKLLPVDSEHSAIWQSLGLDKDRPFKKLILTASGGAFRDKTYEELKSVTASDALKHPNWLMGDKITVDCATMMNKGLEVMEAMWLFNCPLEKIEVIIHPESIIHSMVEYDDSAVVCQLAYPSMEIPIQLALTYPERLKTDVPLLELAGKSLTFKNIDEDKYPCFTLALKSFEMGDNYACAMNAANEAAVGLYLQDKIGFYDISDLIEHVLGKIERLEVTKESLLYTDRLARELVYQKVGVKN